MKSSFCQKIKLFGFWGNQVFFLLKHTKKSPGLHLYNSNAKSLCYSLLWALIINRQCWFTIRFLILCWWFSPIQILKILPPLKIQNFLKTHDFSPVLYKAGYWCEWAVKFKTVTRVCSPFWFWNLWVGPWQRWDFWHRWLLVAPDLHLLLLLLLLLHSGSLLNLAPFLESLCVSFLVRFLPLPGLLTSSPFITYYAGHSFITALTFWLTTPYPHLFCSLLDRPPSSL